MLIYDVSYNFYYVRKDGSLFKSDKNPRFLTVKSDQMIEDNLFKKYLEKYRPCEIEILSICYEDTDDMLSYDDIVT